MGEVRKTFIAFLTPLFVVMPLAGSGMTSMADSPAPDVPTPVPPGLINKGQDQQDPFGDLRPRTPASRLIMSPISTGGPDGFGYTWDDTVAFSWVDATAGTQVNFPGSDDAFSSPVGLGFDFNFYENVYQQLYVSVNGLLTFGTGSTSLSNVSIPQNTSPNNFIAPLWDDLVVGGNFNNGAVYTYSGGTAPNRYLIIEWHEVTRLGSDDLLTFQVALYENGDIGFRYLELNGVLDKATVGIEDGEGIFGLLYLHNSAGLSPGEAVLFRRPAPGARGKFLSEYQGGFAINNEIAFPIQIRNTGELGPDTFNLATTLLGQQGSSVWTVSLFQDGGVTPLTDTNGDGEVDTDLLSQGSTVGIVAVVQASGGSSVGDNSIFELTARSSIDRSKSITTTLQSAIPAPFTQAFADRQIGLGLDLIWANRRSTTEVNQWFSGSRLALSDLPGGGYVFVWERNGVNLSGVPYTDIEYALLDRLGFILEPRIKLTENHNEGQATRQISDRYPAVAFTPDGRVGVVWVRNIINLDITDPAYEKINSNVYLAIMDQKGDLVVSEMGLTGNSAWGGAGNLEVPTYRSPRIAATGDSRFLVSWVDKRTLGAGDTQDVFSALYDRDGTALKSPASLTASTPGGVIYNDPALAELSADRVLVAYSAFDKDLQTYSITFTVLDSDGNVQNPAASIANANGWRPDGVQLSTGKVLLAWTNSTNDELAYVVLDGNNFAVLAGPTTLSNPNSRQSDYVSVTADTAGRGILTWMDSGWNNYLYYALIDENGNQLTPPVVFYIKEDLDEAVFTNYSGQGNAPYEGAWLIHLPMTMR